MGRLSHTAGDNYAENVNKQHHEHTSFLHFVFCVWFLINNKSTKRQKKESKNVCTCLVLAFFIFNVYSCDFCMCVWCVYVSWCGVGYSRGVLTAMPADDPPPHYLGRTLDCVSFASRSLACRLRKFPFRDGLNTRTDERINLSHHQISIIQEL